MARNRCRVASNCSSPGQLLGLTGTSADIMRKLIWEAEKLRACGLLSTPDARDLAYGAINFAITSLSLEDWLRRECWVKPTFGNNNASFTAAVDALVPMQPAFRDIANTAKHGSYRDVNWKGGAVAVVGLDQGGMETPELQLIYQGADGDGRSSFYVYEDTVRDWWTFLNTYLPA